MLQTKITTVFEQGNNAGRTPTLWSLYHYMVETIKLLIRAERTADFPLHLSCITHRMLDVFAAAGHHNYAKAARLYCQMMLKYEKGSVEQRAIIASFKSTGNHVVRYSSDEWSGIWTDLCIEQTLMRTSKSNGGLSERRFRNGESAHRLWVQSLSHSSLIDRLSQKVKPISKSIHQDLGLAQRSTDEKAISLVDSWLEEMQPFDGSNAENNLISFSTGFISKHGDGINPEDAREVGRNIQLKLDGKVPTETLERKMRVESLA